MFIAMNRFKVACGEEQFFEDMWRQRDSYLDGVPGFREFQLLKGEVSDEYALYATHSVWESREAFDAWTHSEAFRKAHAGAGQRRDIYAGPPKLECFEAVLSQ